MSNRTSVKIVTDFSMSADGNEYIIELGNTVATLDRHGNYFEIKNTPSGNHSKYKIIGIERSDSGDFLYVKIEPGLREYVMYSERWEFLKLADSLFQHRIAVTLNIREMQVCTASDEVLLKIADSVLEAEHYKLDSLDDIEVVGADWGLSRDSLLYKFKIPQGPNGSIYARVHNAIVEKMCKAFNA